MLENRMVVGTPGDYYNSPFDRKPIETWRCPACRRQWELYDQYEAERPSTPWECEDKYGYTHLTEDPRLNQCCEICALDSASKDTLVAFVEKHNLVRHMVEALSSGEQYIHLMWDAVKKCESLKTIRDDLADIVEHEHADDFVEWRRER